MLGIMVSFLQRSPIALVGEKVRWLALGCARRALARDHAEKAKQAIGALPTFPNSFMRILGPGSPQSHGNKGRSWELKRSKAEDEATDR